MQNSTNPLDAARLHNTALNMEPDHLHLRTVCTKLRQDLHFSFYSFDCCLDKNFCKTICRKKIKSMLKTILK